ncbi:MAG: arsenate reductase ArsC [Gammaproteobacteria bacterium]|nr:MAG: arsenate reductase ArsC [Gammaproteobacteria bacterium]
MKILFVCTHNRCRSILAEAIANHAGAGVIEARSAGSQPSGVVHPLSIQYLSEAGIPTEGLHSKSWHDMTGWAPDVVITVCDSAAGEACPLWLGNAMRVHWGMADPSRLQGTDDEVAQAFRNTIGILVQRINRLVAANAASMDKQALKQLLDTLGES